MRDDRVYLRHILECMDAIASYAAEGRVFVLHDHAKSDTNKKIQTFFCYKLCC